MNSKPFVYIPSVIKIPYTLISVAFFIMLAFTVYVYVVTSNVSINPDDYNDLGVHTFNSVQFYTKEHRTKNTNGKGYNKSTDYYRVIESDDGLYSETQKIDFSEYNVDYTADLRVLEDTTTGEQYCVDKQITAKTFVDNMVKSHNQRIMMCVILGAVWVISTAAYVIYKKKLSAKS